MKRKYHNNNEIELVSLKKGYPPQQPGYPPETGGYGGGPAYGGGEDAEAKGFEFNDASIRRGFIRKVYAILSVSVSFNHHRSTNHATTHAIFID